MNKPQRGSGVALLIDWANEQDHWVRAIVGAVVTNRRPLGDNSIEEAYQLLLAEKGLASGEGGVVSTPRLSYERELGTADQGLRLTELSDIKNVNALAANQQIAFNPRMTVLYGENGVGKTGYVRILKQLGGVRTAEPILPDIGSKEGARDPKGVVGYQVGDEVATFAWSGEQGVPPFTQMDIFDTRSVDIHVDGELTYAYTPGDLSIFRYAHEAIEAVKERLEKARNETQPSGNPYISKFSRDGTLYAGIETLGASTNIQELEHESVVEESEAGQLEALKERVEALRSGALGVRIQVADSELDLTDRLISSVDCAQAFDPDAYESAIAAVAAAEKAHSRATSEALAQEKIIGVLSGSWNRFVESGEAYLAEHFTEDYPHEGDSCPYCLQELGPGALEVLRKYRAFCRSELQNAVGAARSRLAAFGESFSRLELDRLEVELQRKADSDGDANQNENQTALLECVRAVRSLREAITEGRKVDDDGYRVLTTKVAPILIERRDELVELLQSLRAEASQRKELLTAETAKLRRLQDRLVLRELFPDIRRYVESAVWAARAGTLVVRFRQVGKSLTDTSKVASEQLLNQEFENAFREECDMLRAPRVTLEFPGRKGQPARRKSLTQQHKLSAILSEGEQKVIALADFIAEAMLKRSSSPLVLDDPVTSLDYKRLEHVVDRLVELSEHRQVVIFTHNIWFTMLLLARFEDARTECTYYDVSSDGDSRGVVSIGQSPKFDTWGDKKKRINLLIGRIPQESEKAMRDILVEKGYEDLRGACEIVVEQDLLQRVVQSYAPNVMVDKLTKLRFESLPEASEKVAKVFARCCRFIGSHKQPIETLSVRPTLEDL